MGNKILKYLRFSGIWFGFVVNPCHWQFGWKRGFNVWEDYLFDNSIHLGPIWIRVIIDDGKW
jgi:hypothetical protein